MRGIRASGNWDTDPNAKKDAAGIPPAPPRAPPASPPPCEDRALGAKSPYSVDYCDGKPCTCAFVIPNFVVPACTTAVAACVAAVCAAAIKDWPIYDEYYPAPRHPARRSATRARTRAPRTAPAPAPAPLPTPAA